MIGQGLGAVGGVGHVPPFGGRFEYGYDVLGQIGDGECMGVFFAAEGCSPPPPGFIDGAFRQGQLLGCVGRFRGW